jgi:ActR/RegA family two-component response regulator
LLVDDDEDGVVLLQMLLKRRGIASVIALSCQEAKAKISTTPLSAVVTDLHLGDGDGWTLLPLARPLVPTFVVLTGQGSVAAPPGVCVLQKPVDVERLLAALRGAEGAPT